MNKNKSKMEPFVLCPKITVRLKKWYCFTNWNKPNTADGWAGAALQNTPISKTYDTVKRPKKNINSVTDRTTDQHSKVWSRVSATLKAYLVRKVTKCCHYMALQSFAFLAFSLHSLPMAFYGARKLAATALIATSFGVFCHSSLSEANQAQNPACNQHPARCLFWSILVSSTMRRSSTVHNN